MSFNQSYDYVTQLQEQGQQQARHGRINGDILTGATVIGLSHWLGNRRRQKMGLPQEPMSNVIGVPMAIGLGYVFWWVPFLIYMVLATYVIHIHLIAFLITVGIFVWAWRMWKRRQNKKYAAYYTARAAKPLPKPNDHAPASDEWLAETGARIRKNLGL